MKRAKPRDMTLKQLVERFTAIGIEQYQATLSGQHARFNRLFDEMVAIKDELKKSYFPVQSSQRTGPAERGEGDFGCRA